MSEAGAGAGVKHLTGDALALGNAWASNTVNTVAFRHQGILSTSEYQFSAFYKDRATLRFVRRRIDSPEFDWFDLDGDFNIEDAHCCVSMGIDKSGHLHAAYGHHASQLRYRRSLDPFSVRAWSDELAMTGSHEEKVSYPAFVSLPQSRGLLFVYRTGSHSAAEMRIKQYDSAEQRWFDAASPVLSGSQNAPWTSCPYWNTPAVDAAARLHIAFVWRTHPAEPDQRINNVDIDYAVSADAGETWLSSRGRPFRLPITQVNSETIWPVSPGSNLINQSGMTVSADGIPHVVFYSDDGAGIPQYQHLWLDGQCWRHTYLSFRTEPFLLSGRGTLPQPISRPAVLIDRQDRIYVLSRSELLSQRLVVMRLNPPDYDPREMEMRLLWDKPLDYMEMVIDHQRWSRDGILSMLIQRNSQPPGERVFEDSFEPIHIVEWRLIEHWDEVGS